MEAEFNDFTGKVKKQWNITGVSSGIKVKITLEGSGNNAEFKIFVEDSEEQITIRGDWERNEFFALMKTIMTDLKRV